MSRRAMERNLRLLPAFEASRNLLFWLPVFFLYFSSVLALEEVLLLEACYYLSAVVLEVPSGWFSDRVGRRVTLLIATGAQAVGGALLALTSSFTPFLLGQVFLATAAAFVSGTNEAMLYDSLQAVGRPAEVGLRTQTLVGRGFLALAVSSLLGGLLAGFDLRAAYGLSALAGVASFFLAWRMSEPPRDAEALRPRLRDVAANLRQRTLLWVFAFAVSMTVFNHVPYEFLQPYVDALLEDLGRGSYAPTPAVTGGMFCLIMLLSSWSASRSIAVGERLGRGPALLACMALQGTIIAAMMLFLHPAVLLLLALRSVPQGLSYPILSAVVQPRIAAGTRATYLSVQSLAGRLAFAATLFLASRAVGGRQWSLGAVSGVLGAYLAGLAVVFVLLLLTIAWVRDEGAGGAADEDRDRDGPRSRES